MNIFKILYDIYFIKHSNRKLNQLHCSVFQRIIVRLLSLYLPIRSVISNSLPYTSDKNKQLIVSLTTFPPRINKLWLVIESILNQTKKPDKIILWLYEGEFNGKESLPRSLRRLEKRGLEIRFCSENLLPHKKYYYTLKEHPESTIITVDDDMIYPPGLIENLIRHHKKYPQTVICSRAERILTDGDRLLPNGRWKNVNHTTGPLHQNLNIGCGGVLYPPGALHKDVLDMDVIKKIALKADDLWLKIMALRNDTKVACIGGMFPRYFVQIRYKNNKTLLTENLGEGNNDKVITGLMKHYGISAQEFTDEEETENNL